MSAKVLLILIAVTTVVHGQGEMIFYNRTPVGDAPVVLADGSGPGTTMRVGLYLLRGGAVELIETTTFRSGPEPLPRFFERKLVSVPGVPPGESATFRIRVWPAKMPSFEDALAAGGCYGEFLTTNGTPDIVIPALGDPDPGGQTPVHTPYPEGIIKLVIPCKRDPSQPSVLTPAILLTPPHVQSSGLSFDILSGFLRRNLVLQSSTNGVDWLASSTFSGATNRFHFSDTINKRAEMFRVVTTTEPN